MLLIKKIIGDRFKYGISVGLATFNFNRFVNKAYRFEVIGPSVLSPATGHWPFHTFHLAVVTGSRKNWQLTVCGITVGSTMLQNIDNDGFLIGPDYRKRYVFFMALNHQHKSLEEIIS